MIPVVAKEWTLYKIRFADLKYENWGKIKADFDLNSDFITTINEIKINRGGENVLTLFVDYWSDFTKKLIEKKEKLENSKLVSLNYYETIKI